MKEVLSYLLLVIGVALDQISTNIVLNRPDFYEANKHALKLMGLGLWLPIDLLIIATSILLPVIAVRTMKHPARWAVLAYPITLGLIRMSAGFWNLILLLT